MQSGETFTLEMATHLAGDAPELMIDGDPAIGEIYKWVGGPAPCIPKLAVLLMT